MSNLSPSKSLVIVTGASKGIGKAISLKLANSSLSDLVVATYSNSPFESYHEKVLPWHLDIQNAANVDQFFLQLQEKYPDYSLKGLVNNAGIRKDSLVLSMEEKSWDNVLDINLKGTYLVSKKALEWMLSSRAGSIVNIGSVGAQLCLTGQANYSASKAGLVALTKTLAKEVAKKGIRVNCLAPGFIQTEFIEDLDPQLVQEYKKLIPMKRFGTPEEVANAAYFLLSPESSYITGIDLQIHGGLA